MCIWYNLALKLKNVEELKRGGLMAFCDKTSGSKGEKVDPEKSHVVPY